MRHRPLVLAIALSMAAFLLLIVTAQMQEIGGQTAELPARPWWHCGYTVEFPHEYGGPIRVGVPCKRINRVYLNSPFVRHATATAVARRYDSVERI